MEEKAGGSDKQVKLCVLQSMCVCVSILQNVCVCVCVCVWQKEGQKLGRKVGG